MSDKKVCISVNIIITLEQRDLLQRIADVMETPVGRLIYEQTSFSLESLLSAPLAVSPEMREFDDIDDGSDNGEYEV